MSAADIGPGALIINPDGSINVDVLEKVRREYKGKSFIRNMYAKALLLCLNTIADRYYKGSKPGEIDRSKRLDPSVAHDINEQFNALLKELSEQQERTVEGHRSFLREKVTMFIHGTLPRIRKQYFGKEGLVDAHKEVIKQAVKANLTEDETIISEDQYFRDFMSDLDKAGKDDFENGTRGVFLFAFKVMGANLKDAVVGGAVAAKQKIGAAAVAAKDTAAGVLHRRGKSGEVKVAEISSPIGVKPHSPTNANVKKPEQPAEYKRPSVAPREQHDATRQPAEYNRNQSQQDARNRASLEREYGKPVPPPPMTKKQPPPLPKGRPVVTETPRKAPPLPTKATMDAARAKHAGTHQDSASKPVVPGYGGVQLKKTQPIQKAVTEKQKTEFQKKSEEFAAKNRGNESNPPPKRGGSPSGSSM